VTSNQCSATGTILREEWRGVQGNDIAQIPQMSMPQSSNEITVFEAPSDAGNNFGQRIRGFICPPQTGYYTFYIAGDDATELWLSNSALPSGRKKIAYNLSWTAFREWNKFASQKSAPVLLEAGKRYYIDALHKEGAGDDHLSVAWQLPDGSMEAPINGSRLSPIIVENVTSFGIAQSRSAQTQETEQQLPVTNAAGMKASPNPFSQRTTVEITAPQAGIVRIEVCDVSGTVVKQLFRGTLREKERRLFELDGTTLHSGIYFVRMISGPSFKTLKVIRID
jgi:hypothetical protein